MIDFATFLLSYWIGRINVFRVIVVGRLGEYDFHMSTLMISHIDCNCQKNFQPMEMAGPLREITFDFITHEDIEDKRETALLVKTC